MFETIEPIKIGLQTKIFVISTFDATFNGKFIACNDFFGIFLAHSKKSSNFAVNMTSHASHQNSAPGEVFEFIYGYEVRKEAHRHI